MTRRRIEIKGRRRKGGSVREEGREREGGRESGRKRREREGGRGEKEFVSSTNIHALCTHAVNILIAA